MQSTTDKDGNPMPDGDVLYKFDIPANRYDLLCMEGTLLHWYIYWRLDYLWLRHCSRSSFVLGQGQQIT